jgi:hypothetical protein
MKKDGIDLKRIKDRLCMLLPQKFIGMLESLTEFV